MRISVMKELIQAEGVLVLLPSSLWVQAGLSKMFSQTILVIRKLSNNELLHSKKVVQYISKNIFTWPYILIS